MLIKVDPEINTEKKSKSFYKIIHKPKYARNKIHFMTSIKLQVSGPGCHPRAVFFRTKDHKSNTLIYALYRPYRNKQNFKI